MKCPECGHDIPDTVQTCSNCGAEVSRAATHVSVSQKAGTIRDEGKATAVEVGKAGDVSITVQAERTPAHAERVRVPPDARHRLFGRDDELVKVTAALRDRQTVLLHGMGGIGKTALAAEVVQRLHAGNHFDDGILWVREIREAPVAAICDAIARDLGDDNILERAPAAKLTPTRYLLAGHDLLLILDDVAAAGTVDAFLDHCRPPEMPLLVTSRRHHLGFDADVHLRPLERDAAIALFRDRANVPAANGQVGEICDVLENHPLALVIAAGRVRAERMPLDRLHARLADEKTRLSSLKLGADKNRNVWASLKLSYAGLTADQQRVFTYLAACFGDTTGLELLAEICGLSQTECEDHVGRLVTRSLVEREGNRLRLHQLVRDFGRDILGAERQAVEKQIIAAVGIFAQRYGQDTPADHDQLEAELDNVLGALNAAERHEEWRTTLTLAEKIGLPVSGVLGVRGYWTNLVTVTRLGVLAAEQTGDEEALARWLHNTAVALQNQGDYDTARDFCQQALEINRQLGYQVRIASSLNNLGLIAQDQGDYEAARDFYQQALEIDEQLENLAGIADSLNNLGMIAQHQGNYDDARNFYQQALEIDEQLGSQAGMASTLHNLGVIAQDRGDYGDARDFYQQALVIFERLGNQGGIASSLHQLGVIAQDQGNYDAARDLYQQSLEIKVRLGDQAGIATSLGQLGRLAQAQGDYDAAHTFYQQSLEIFERLKSPYAEMALRHLASLDDEQTDSDK